MRLRHLAHRSCGDPSWPDEGPKVMAEVTTYKFTGDKYKGQGLWKLGLNQLEILKRQMELGNLKIYERTVSFADGTRIHCKRVHGISTIDIHCPEGGER